MVSSSCVHLVFVFRHFFTEERPFFPNFFPSKKNLIFLFLGAILDHFGFAGILSTLTDKLNIFCETFFPHIGPLDEHHGFIVEYAKGKDVKLDFHVRIFFSKLLLLFCLKSKTGINSEEILRKLSSSSSCTTSFYFCNLF